MASALSFHCIICIEEFDQRDHYPVVLPCGHTYVCNQCAERLTKCMECRESLFVQNDPTTIPYRPENQITNNNDPNSRYSNRSASFRSLPPNVRPSVFSLRNKRLPLPKNIVLLSLIDATAVLSSSAQYLNQQSNHTSQIEDYESSGDIQVSLSYDEKENEDQEERLQIGTWLAASGCGTYVITNIQGVQVYPTIELHQDSNDEDDDDIATKSLDFASRSHDITCDETAGMFHSSDDHKPIYLRKGDRVQVVYIENGWAKLARDYGFIPIGDKNIVRVGESMDQSCTLEAILRYTEMEKQELNHRLTKVSNRFSQVTNELQRTYDYCDDLTIVTADTSIPQDEIKVTFLDESNERDSHKLKSASTGSDMSYQTPRTANVFSIPTNSTQSTFSCITESLFTNFGVSSEMTDDAVSVGNPRSELFSGIMRAFSITENTSVTQAHNRDILRAVSYPSPRSVLDSSLREQRLRPGARVSVDFRTGMSGHLALLSTQRNKTLAKSYPSMLGKMSSHTGLTLTTRKSLTPRIPKIGE